MIANGPTQTLTADEVEGFYDSLLEKVRERHDNGESWEKAVAHAVMRIGEGEAAAIFGYLRAQTTLPRVDVLLVVALAGRLGIKIEFRRVQIKEGWE